MVDLKNEHLIEGINSRMDGIVGAVLNVKLKYIDKFNTKEITLQNYIINF